MTLNMLLTQAYGLRSDRIDGPSWLQDDKFDVEAKIPPNGDLIFAAYFPITLTTAASGPFHTAGPS